MEKRDILIFIALLSFALLLIQTSCNNRQAIDLKKDRSKAYFTGSYRNLFRELLDLSDAQVQARLDSTYTQLFYGNDETQRVYYPVEPDMAYVMDIASNDVRSEGMSYGMMVTVQLNEKQEFDRIWKWAKPVCSTSREAVKIISPGIAELTVRFWIRTRLLMARNGSSWHSSSLLPAGEQGRESITTRQRHKPFWMPC